MSARGLSALVLGGGVGSERDVSIAGAAAVAAALERAGFAVHREIVERLTADDLARLPGDVVFPVLHGPWGEGGPMQDLLERDGRPYVGSGPAASRLAMDKMALKLIAAGLGIATPSACVFDADDPGRPLPLPVVVKPVREGSTVGLMVCRTEVEWDHARRAAARSGGAHMIERLIAGREVTVGVVGGEKLPVIEIVPADGFYDYDAKYSRDDTRYIVNPDIPSRVADEITAATLELFDAIGARHIARADFIIDDAGEAWFLELNTMPGFTDHSLVPMAARARPGGAWAMPDLCARLIDGALAGTTQHSAAKEG